MLFLLAVVITVVSTAAGQGGVVFIDRAHGDTSTSPVVTQELVQSVGFDVAESTTFPSDLTPYSVLILDVPSWAYSADEIDGIVQFVAAGGGLLVLGEYSEGTGAIANTVDPLLANFGYSVVEENSGGGPYRRSDGRILDLPVTHVPNLIQQVNAGWVATVTYPAGGAPFILSGGYGDVPAGTPVAAAGGYYAGRVVVTGDNDFIDPTASEGTDSAALLQNMLTWLANESPQPVCFSSFEDERSPFTTFADGNAETNTWRTPLTATPAARSGLYAMTSDVTGIASTGLQLDLPGELAEPAEVSLQAWANVQEWTTDGAAVVVGFAFTDDFPIGLDSTPAVAGWQAASDGTSFLRLLTTQQATAAGIAPGAWRLVQVRFVRDTGLVSAWIDGTRVGEGVAPGAAGTMPRHALMGALGSAASAGARVLFDDTRVTVTGYAGTPASDRIYASLEGPEQVAQGHTYGYTLAYGNGYPLTPPAPVETTLPAPTYVAVMLPPGYALDASDVAPDRMSGQTAIFQIPTPERGQAGAICLSLAVPTGPAEVQPDRIWVWATQDPQAASAPPPASAGYATPADSVWSEPQDFLPQSVALVAQPDVWVKKQGPKTSCPGLTTGFTITVGNCGTAPAHNIVVRDLLPPEMGGGEVVVANLESLGPNETWSGLTLATPQWGLTDGTLITNTATVTAAEDELSLENNTSQWSLTSLSAEDPNAISVAPEGSVEPGERLTYTLQCENAGDGIAYDVYATAALDPRLDAASLLISDPGKMEYDPASRTLVWEVGTLQPQGQASTTFSVLVSSSAPRARSIHMQAVVNFSSVPEETPTNVAVDVIPGSFSDVPWDYWAVLPVEVAYENGIVQGYGDATYRPAVAVTRDQMAVYISRALAGGEAAVPAGPSTASFADVPTDYWAFKYVEYAVAQNVVKGYPDGSYAPAEQVTRDQMAVYIARAIASPTGDAGLVNYTPPGTPSFLDVAADSWAYRYVEYAEQRGVISGYPDGTYQPGNVVTRDQMAVYMQRAFDLPM